MAISAADAIGPGFSRMAQICFKPFSIGKWFVMGFCAFLSTCGVGGQSYNWTRPSGSRGSSGSGGGTSYADVSHFVSTHVMLVVMLAIVGFILWSGIWVLSIYLRSRGRFMFLDNIVLNRGAVAEPWRRYRDQAMSYFWFSLILSLIAFLATLMIAGIALLLAWPDIQAGAFSGHGVAAIVVGALLLLPTIFILGIVESLIYDFVVPIMMIRSVGIGAAWREAKAEVFRGQVGQLVIFFLLRILFSLGSAVVAMIAVCGTCCIGGLPYLSSVLLLPVLVFDRTFALSFLEQFHGDYVLMRYAPAEPTGFPVVEVEENGPPRML